MKSDINDIIEHITKAIIFDKTTLESEEINPDVWKKHLSLATKKNRKTGDYLLRTGENLQGMYFVKSGKVKCDILGKEGTVKTFSIIGEDCLVGEQFVFHEQPGLFEIMVVEDAELYFFNKDTVMEIIKQDFEASLALTKVLSIKSRMLASQLEDMCLRNILQCICRILYSLCCYEEKSGKIEGDISIYLSHQDLANMLGSHRVTISKNINRLKKEGIIDYKYEKIIIKDKLKLKELAFV